MKKKRRTRRASYWGKVIAGKGGKTTNFEIQDKDRREQKK